jgi:hypothetical protein
MAGTICPVHGDTTTPDPVIGFPVGGIIMWSGTLAKVPVGWALCDGANGTPDLRNRFICGAGSTLAVGDTGGSNVAHSHSVSMSSSGTASGTISSESLSAHTGTAVDTHSDHTHSISALTTDGPSATQSKKEGTGSSMDVPTPGHTHSTSATYTGTMYDAVGGGRSHTVTQPSAHSAHSHTFSSGSASVSGSATSGTASSMPAYYALAYIMRVA